LHSNLKRHLKTEAMEERYICGFQSLGYFMPIDFFMMLHLEAFRWGKGGGYGLTHTPHFFLFP